MSKKTTYIFLAFGILIYNLFLSCTTEEIDGHDPVSDSIEFVYVNESDYPIHLILYKQNKTGIDRINYLIDSGDEITFLDEASYSTSDKLITTSDSIKVIFDKKKILKFTPHDGDIEKSLYRYGSYKNGSRDQQRVLKYFFTNQDFDRANNYIKEYDALD